MHRNNWLSGPTGNCRHDDRTALRNPSPSHSWSRWREKWKIGSIGLCNTLSVSVNQSPELKRQTEAGEKIVWNLVIEHPEINSKQSWVTFSANPYSLGLPERNWGGFSAARWLHQIFKAFGPDFGRVYFFVFVFGLCTSGNSRNSRKSLCWCAAPYKTEEWSVEKTCWRALASFGVSLVLWHSFTWYP